MTRDEILNRIKVVMDIPHDAESVTPPEGTMEIIAATMAHQMLLEAFIATMMKSIREGEEVHDRDMTKMINLAQMVGILKCMVHDAWDRDQMQSLMKSI